MSLTYGSLVDPPALLLNGCGRSHRVTPESLLKRMKPAAMAFERTATIRNENKDDREKRKEDGAVGGRAAFPLPARVSTALIARSAIAVVALGFIDAGYSGDWSRIGVISRETEEVLRQAAYFVEQRNPATKITYVRLNGSNYLVWSGSAMLYLSERSKLEYETGDLPKPNENDSTYKEWCSNNYLFMSWLINTMEPKICQGFFAETATQIWRKAKDLYNEKK